MTATPVTTLPKLILTFFMSLFPNKFNHTVPKVRLESTEFFAQMRLVVMFGNGFVHFILTHLKLRTAAWLEV